MTRWFCLIPAFLLLAAAVERPPKTPRVGALAPDFEVKLADGTRLKLADMRGDVVVLNFWATWCVPCRAELPLLDRYTELRRSAGLRVIAITTEGSVPAFKLKPLFAKMKMSPALSIKGPYHDIRAVPTNIVIDRTGRVRYAEAGAFTLDSLNDTLIPLLREPRPATPGLPN